MESTGSSEIKFRCAICGKEKPKDEFPIVEYVIRKSSDANEEVIGRYFCICYDCLEKIRKEDDRELIENGGIL